MNKKSITQEDRMRTVHGVDRPDNVSSVNPDYSTNITGDGRLQIVNAAGHAANNCTSGMGPADADLAAV